MSSRPFADLTEREADAVIEGLTFHQSMLMDNTPYAEGITAEQMLQRIGDPLPPQTARWVWYEIDLPLLDWKITRKSADPSDAYRLLADVAQNIGSVPGMVEIQDGHCRASRYGLRVTFIVTSPIPHGGLLLLSVETTPST